MKGITLISDIFLLLVQLSITIIMVLFINALIITFQVENKLTNGGMPTTRNIEMRLFIKPVNYDALMSSFLEYEIQGVKVKRLLSAAAIQGSTNVWLEGKTIDVSAAADEFFKSNAKSYILKLGDMTVSSGGELSSSSSPLGLQKISTFAILLDGKETYLQLFVVD